MYVTLREALTLDIFKNFKLLAGVDGLDKSITRIGLLDHEMINPIQGQFVEGEFALSTLLAAKDNPSLIYSSVVYLIESGASGLGVKDIYYSELPEQVLSLADLKGFPIFIFDNSVYFEDVITEFKTFMDQVKEEFSTNDAIHKLLTSTDEETVAQIYKRYFEDFKGEYQVFYFRQRMTDAVTSGFLLKGYGMARRISVAMSGAYLDGLFVVTKNMDDEARQRLIIESGLSATLGYYYGMSRKYSSSGDLKLAFEESLMNARIADVERWDCGSSEKRGIYQLLLSNQMQEDFVVYRDNHITPIMAYDTQNGTALLETAMSFVKNEGAIKATATHMRQHSNTIRYRLSKVKQILEMDGSDTVLYERLSIAIKLYLLSQLNY